jgi:iron-sulfur cluster insertion protein
MSDFSFAITDAAAERIKILLQEETNPETLKLRISVTGGGCSGFQYHFVFDDQILADDQVFEHQGAYVVIDETSLELLKGSMIDFVEDLAASMFVIKNPNAASSCGCGNSFSV